MMLKHAPMSNKEKMFWLCSALLLVSLRWVTTSLLVFLFFVFLVCLLLPAAASTASWSVSQLHQRREVSQSSQAGCQMCSPAMNAGEGRSARHVSGAVMTNRC